MNRISFVRIVIAVFIFTEVLENILIILFLGDFDQHFAIGDTIVLHITLVGIIACRRFVFLVLHQLESRDIALALGDIDIEAITRETEQQFTTLGQILPFQFDCV